MSGDDNDDNVNTNNNTTASSNSLSSMLGKLFDTLIANIQHSMDNNEESRNLNSLTSNQLQQALESLDIIATSIETLELTFAISNDDDTSSAKTINKDTFVNEMSNDNNIDSNDKIRSLKETVRNTALKGDKIDDIKNENGNDNNGNETGIENDTGMFFVGTRSKSRSVINNDSTFQLKDAMNKKHEKHGKNGKNEKHKNKNRRQSKKHSSKHKNSEIENSENNGDDNNNDDDDEAPKIMKMVSFSDTIKKREAKEREGKKAPNLLRILQKAARRNPNFGDVFRCHNWNSEEVCNWLITIGLENTIYKFYAKSIDGPMLLSSVTINDKNTSNLKSFLDGCEIRLHKSEMTTLLQEIIQLKKVLFCFVVLCFFVCFFSFYCFFLFLVFWPKVVSFCLSTCFVVCMY